MASLGLAKERTTTNLPRNSYGKLGNSYGELGIVMVNWDGNSYGKLGKIATRAVRKAIATFAFLGRVYLQTAENK